MKFKADLHVHSVLSGCADKENSVPNIVNLSGLLETEILALSDHNAVENVPAAMELGKEMGILVIPAMEVTTSEDAHILCLFPDTEGAFSVCRKIRESMPKYTVNTEFYNEQRVTDKEDNTLQVIDYLLSVACGFDVFEVFRLVREAGGVAIPAHVDKESNGLMAILGEIPDELGVTTVEVSSGCDAETEARLRQKYRVIKSSDAHDLESLCRNEFYIELRERSALCLINELNNKRE